MPDTYPPGTTLADAVTWTAQEAQHRGQRVENTFNDTPLVVEPGDSLNQIVDRYEQARADQQWQMPPLNHPRVQALLRVMREVTTVHHADTRGICTCEWASVHISWHVQDLVVERWQQQGLMQPRSGR